MFVPEDRRMDCLPREHGSSHLVTLISEKDQAGNFIAWLPQPLHLARGFYDVGVLELRCFKVPSATALAPIAPVKAPEGTCSDQGENMECEESPQPGTSSISRILAVEEPLLFPGIAPPEIGYVQFVYRKQASLMEFSMEFAAAMDKGSYPVRLGFDYVTDDEAIANWRSLSSAPSDMYYVIPEELAYVTGFTRRFFSSGEFNGERTVTEQELKLLEDGELYSLETVKYPYKLNLISVNRRYKDLVRVRFEHKTIDDFLKYIKERAATVNCVVQLDMLEDGRIKLTYTPAKEEDYLKMPAKLLDILGFVKTDTFTSGEYISEFSYSEEQFAKLVPVHEFVLEIGRYIETLQPMSEPSKHDYHNVVTTLNDSFIEWNYDDFEPEFVLDDGSIFVNNIPQHVYITLPAPVCEFFGIDSNTKFTHSTRIPVGEAIRSIQMKEQDDQNQRENVITLPPQPTSAQEVLLLLDIVMNQNFANRLAPVVQHCRWDINSDLVLHAQPVLYLPLCCEHLNCIRVMLTDAYLVPLNLQEYVTILRLHFKPRFL